MDAKGMTKAQLVKTWKQLDGALEAIEKLEEHGVEVSERIDSTAINSLKNNVEEIIESRKGKKVELS